MSRIFPLLTLALCFSLAAPALAQMIRITDNDLLGQSDLIIVGTVVSDTRLPDVDFWHGGQAVITVDRVLRGPKVDKVTVGHGVPPNTPGVMVMDHGGFMLTPGQQSIFFLQRAPGGYTLAAGMQGVKPADDADNYVKMIAEFPFTLILTPVPPCAFGQPVTVTMTVKNTGATPVECYNPTLEAQFYAPRMGGTAPFSVVAKPGQDFRTPQPIEVQPGGETKLTVSMVCAKPASWALFTPDTYLQTPVMARARVFLQPVGAANVNLRTIPGFTVASEWMTVLVGFPPPADSASTAPAKK